jgi:shikimate kinase
MVYGQWPLVKRRKMNSLEDNSSVTSDLGLIFLIGFMGCGKTTLGRKLASRLGYEFMDLDHILEAQVGMNIAGYFSTHGEDAFRKLESEVLKQTVYPKHAVISTGGGLPCFFDNMQWINAHGRSVYIQLSPKTLADRLEHEKTKRPLLRDKHGDALIDFIGEKLTEREPFYKQATIIANGLSLTAEKAEALLK